jgi:hypothetical protein
MKKPKAEALILKSIKFKPSHIKYLEHKAQTQGHYSFSEAVKRCVERDMGVA